MTAEELIAEGRRLQRPCAFLRPSGAGEIAAVWHAHEKAPTNDDGFRPWLSVDTRFVTGSTSLSARFLTILTDEEDGVSGRVDVVPALPPGLPLYAQPAAVLPPVDAVFACGSAAVEHWLHVNGWSRTERYNDNFADWAVVNTYEQVWFREYPLYLEDPGLYAVLGGWHFPGPDDDWHALIPQRLLALTLRDSEPWVEAWQADSGEYQVIQRVT